ncbi:hypothetical protein ACHAW5_002416 [Stephanodiscus triporus]|uniref:CRM domain-containing protein n=1 Tax=Stephanodiscus triporus TaxID=2934178 RepID=A0ABD3NYZ8_9STRA
MAARRGLRAVRGLRPRRRRRRGGEVHDDHHDDHGHDDGASTAGGIAGVIAPPPRRLRLDDERPDRVRAAASAGTNVTGVRHPRALLSRRSYAAVRVVPRRPGRSTGRRGMQGSESEGGRMRVLADAGIDVRVLERHSRRRRRRRSRRQKCDYGEMDAAVRGMSANLIRYFVKRISPRPPGSTRNLDDVVDGRRRRALRTIAGRMKNDGTMRQIEWPGGKKIVARDEDDDEDAKEGDWIDVARRLPIDVGFLEAIDGCLWDHEMVLLRLNGAVRKKGGAKVLSGRVAEILDAHVAQVIGHTALLYRPAFPPVLDLDELVDKMEG